MSEHGSLLSSLIKHFDLLQNPQDYPNYQKLLAARAYPIPALQTRAAAAAAVVRKPSVKRRSLSTSDEETTLKIKKHIGEGKPSLLGRISFSSWNKNLSI